MPLYTPNLSLIRSIENCNLNSWLLKANHDRTIALCALQDGEDLTAIRHYHDMRRVMYGFFTPIAGFERLLAHRSPAVLHGKYATLEHALRVYEKAVERSRSDENTVFQPVDVEVLRSFPISDVTLDDYLGRLEAEVGKDTDSLLRAYQRSSWYSELEGVLVVDRDEKDDSGDEEVESTNGSLCTPSSSSQGAGPATNVTATATATATATPTADEEALLDQTDGFSWVDEEELERAAEDLRAVHDHFAMNGCRGRKRIR